MSVYRIDADYNAAGPVLTDSDDDFPARIQVATKHSFGELRLSRHDFESVLALVTKVAANSEPADCEIDGGSVAIDAAPPTAEDTWELDIQKDRLHHRVVLSDGELEGLADLLRTVHPDHDSTDNPDVEVRA
ncbi:hypothetical protein [Natrinema ejinorense]|uniref:Uncharacterized protein n=1 Tax=Natrinema ejinorense TaxID=373386 RepID=A0A2A5QPA7_9EURY|nr:hypothetical protein [Natrinema ejinorense]PCR88654.1 hypothetical protein CP557_21725 [Natrinema ejinorense]